MPHTDEPDRRTAAPTGSPSTSTMVLINRFVVPEADDGEFRSLWAQTSAYFRGCTGFVALRLVRATGPATPERWVNIATWASEADYRAAHATPEFRRLVSQPGWRAFPSSPAVYELVVSAG